MANSINPTRYEDFVTRRWLITMSRATLTVLEKRVMDMWFKKNAVGITKITKKDGMVLTLLNDKDGYENLKVRLPYSAKVSNYNADSNNVYLYDYLNLHNDIQANPISKILGYCTLASRVNDSARTLIVYYTGVVSNDGRVYLNNHFGVRPVITLLQTALK